MNEREPEVDAGRGARLSIGAFAREARLTLKALRLYDALGLLLPAFVDPQSGYRFYEQGQLERARLIGLLRQLDMPISRIAGVLERSGAAAAQAIGAYWREVEQDAAIKRQLVSYLEGDLRGKGEHMYEVKMREVPEQKVVTLERHASVKDLPNFSQEAFRTLYGALAKAGVQACGPGLVIFHGKVDEDNDGPVEVCVPFEGMLEPPGEARIRLERAHREAFTTVTKSQWAFPGILGAYDAVYDALQERGLQMGGSPREVYFVSPDAVGDDQPVCDVAYPVSVHP